MTRADIQRFNSKVFTSIEDVWRADVCYRGKHIVGSFVKQPLTLTLETGGTQVHVRGKLHLRFATLTVAPKVGNRLTVDGEAWRVASVRPDIPARQWVCELEDPSL